MNARLGGATIDFAAVPHLDNFNGAGCVIDRINDSELTLANAVSGCGEYPDSGVT